MCWWRGGDEQQLLFFYLLTPQPFVATTLFFLSFFPRIRSIESGGGGGGANVLLLLFGCFDKTPIPFVDDGSAYARIHPTPLGLQPRHGRLAPARDRSLLPGTGALRPHAAARVRRPLSKPEMSHAGPGETKKIHLHILGTDLSASKCNTGVGCYVRPWWWFG